MQIEYECCGGFANLNLRLRVDTRSPGPQPSAALEALVDHVRFFEAAMPDATPPSRTPLRDSLHYRLSISDGQRHRSLELSDHAVPVSFRPLLQFLQQMAVGRKQNDG